MTAALGVDIGTSAVRAAVVDRDGTLLGSARRALHTHLSPGRAEHDPGAWVAGALAAGAEAVAEAGAGRPVEIEVVGVSGLGPAPVLVDGSGAPLTRAPLFGLDTRAEVERARLGVSHDHALPKLLWWAEHEPERIARAVVALDAVGVVVLALTGVTTMDTVTSASWTSAGVPPPVRVPAPVDPLTIVGGLTSNAAAALGLAVGTPVCAGTIDCFADVAGLDVGVGDGALLIGSTLVLYALHAAPVVAPPGLELSAYPGPGLLVGGSTATAGLALRWFERELGGPEADAPAEAAATLEPGAGGLLALPYLAGERTPLHDPDARGALLGLTLGTRRAELYRALVDGLALTALDHVDRLAEAGLAPPVWRVTGGLAAHPAVPAAVADALGTPLELMAHAGHAIGPAALALRAIGTSWHPQPVRRVEPRPDRTARLRELLELLRGAYAALRPTLHALGRLEPREPDP